MEMVNLSLSTKKKGIYMCSHGYGRWGKRPQESEICFGPKYVGPSGNFGPSGIWSGPSPDTHQQGKGLEAQEGRTKVGHRSGPAGIWSGPSPVPVQHGKA